MASPSNDKNEDAGTTKVFLHVADDEELPLCGTAATPSTKCSNRSEFTHPCSIVAGAFPKRPSNARKWARFTDVNRHHIVIFWLLLVCPIGLYSGYQFILSTTMEYDPPPGAPSAKAKELFMNKFEVSEWDRDRPVLIMLNKKDDTKEHGTLIDGTSILYETSRDFVFNMTTLLDNVTDRIRDSTYRGAKCDSCEEIPKIYAKVQSYYSLEREGLLALAKRVSSTSDGCTTVISIKSSIPPEAKNLFLDEILTYGRKEVPAGMTISFLGVDLLEKATLDSFFDDLEFMHMYIAPIAMLILAVVLGNLPIMVAPVLSIVTSILASATIMYAITPFTKVAQFTPSEMMALTTALSIDYSLFLLSRCTDDVALGLERKEAIVSMVEHAGHTIFVSALTLSGCCIMTMILPVTIVGTVGLGATVSIICSFVVSISLTPALMHTSLGAWFLKPNRFFSLLCCNEPGNPGRTRLLQKKQTVSCSYEKCSRVDSHDTDLEQESASPLLPEIAEDIRRSVWFRMGKVLLDPCKGTLVLLLIVGIIFPVARFIQDIQPSLQLEQMLSSNSSGILALHEVGEKFGYGTLTPYRIIFDCSSSGNSINTEESFAVIGAVLDELTGNDFAATPTLSSFSGITTIGGVDIPFSLYQSAIKCGIDCPNEALRTIAMLSKYEFNAPSGATTIVYAMLSVDPFSPPGTDWLFRARQKIRQLSNTGKLQNFDVAIAGEVAELYDAVDSINSRFPLMVGATFVAVFMVMYFFQSILVPILSILSIMLTQAFVYGMAVLVFQRGALDFLGVRGLSNAGGLFWIEPILCFTVVVGLGLDYDIFLISRVLEFRMEGYTHKSSILLGMYKTRGVISAAGIIMSICLGGLLRSEARMVNEISFFLASAVLTDTFVIRTTVAPILLGYLGDCTWWPRKLPPGTKDITHL